MNITLIAADIARRRKALAEDSAENVEQLIYGMLSEAKFNAAPNDVKEFWKGISIVFGVRLGHFNTMLDVANEVDRLKLQIKKLRENGNFQNQSLMRKNKTIRMMNAAHKALMIERDNAARNAVEFMLKINGEYHGCLTGDCPHTSNADCIKHLVSELTTTKN